jgi:hypothetical protein
LHYRCSKGLPKAKSLQSQKVAAKIECPELAAKFAPAESNISMFCDAFWETKFKLRNFQKETGITKLAA